MDEAFFRACLEGDVAAVRAALADNPRLVHAREPGDNALPLHFAAANGQLEVVRLLLDAGSDVQGKGDLHDGDVIGWAAGSENSIRNEIIRLLLERGAKHHIFSAIAMNDPTLVRRVVTEDSTSLQRRRSKFEQGQTPLHFALGNPDGLGPKDPRYDMAELLIQLGIDVNAPDSLGRTAIELAMLRGDTKAVRLLRAAGAREPDIRIPANVEELLGGVRSSVTRIVPMLCVADVDATVAFYQAIGFTLRERVPDEGPMGWAMLEFGRTPIMVQPSGTRAPGSIALWFYLTRIDELYGLLKGRLIEAMRNGGQAPFTFDEDLHEAHYGGRQFTIRDHNDLEIVFYAE